MNVFNDISEEDSVEEDDNSLSLTTSEDNFQPEEYQEIVKSETKISKTLSEKTIRTVILLILLMLFLLPFLSEDTYVTTVTSYHLGIKTILKFYEDYGQDDPSTIQVINKYWDYHASLVKPIIFLELPGDFIKKRNEIHRYREEECHKATIE